MRNVSVPGILKWIYVHEVSVKDGEQEKVHHQMRNVSVPRMEKWIYEDHKFENENTVWQGGGFSEEREARKSASFLVYKVYAAFST